MMRVAEQGDEADEAFGGMVARMDMPPNARAASFGRGHRFAAYPRCSADTERVRTPEAAGGGAVVRESDLTVGVTYFMVTYPDPTMVTPIVISYRYLGRDFAGTGADSGAVEYHFRYLPAFGHEVDSTADASWEADYPAQFAGWGEKVPTAFSADKLKGFLTLDGLIQELAGVRDRILKGPLS